MATIRIEGNCRPSSPHKKGTRSTRPGIVSLYSLLGLSALVLRPLPLSALALRPLALSALVLRPLLRLLPRVGVAVGVRVGGAGGEGGGRRPGRVRVTLRSTDFLILSISLTSRERKLRTVFWRASES